MTETFTAFDSVPPICRDCGVALQAIVQPTTIDALLTGYFGLTLGSLSSMMPSPAMEFIASYVFRARPSGRIERIASPYFQARIT